MTKEKDPFNRTRWAIITLFGMIMIIVGYVTGFFDVSLGWGMKIFGLITVIIGIKYWFKEIRDGN